MATVFKTNNKMLRAGNNMFGYTEDLTLYFTGISQFPRKRNVSTNGAFFLHFSQATAIIVNYGNGVSVQYSAIYVSENNYQVSITSGDAAPAADQYPPYVYPDGQLLNRTIKISYRKDLLSQIRSVNVSGYTISPLNFRFFEHRKLNNFEFVNAGNFITSLYLAGVSSNTNPELTAINLSAFAPESPFYTKVPVDILNILLTSLSIGSNGYSTVALAATELDKIATYPIKATLRSLTLADTLMTDAQGLPANFSTFPALTQLTLYNANFTTIPAVVNTMPFITYLRLGGNGLFTSIGNISNLINLVNLDFTLSSNIYQMGNFPAYFNSFTKVRTISFNSAGVNIASNCNAIVSIVYNLITRNAPMTGAVNGTIPYRGMTIALTNTVTSNGATAIVASTIVQPAGYVSGTSNGTPANAGEQIWVLRNQYGTTITLTV